MWLRDTLERLFGKKGWENGPAPLRDDLGGGFYYTYREAPNGFGGYHAVDMCLKKEGAPRFCRRITGPDGSFVSFPGVVRGPWEKRLEGTFRKTVMYSCQLLPFHDGRAEFRWMLQPDGRYFADEDGFGAEDCQEIWLRSCIGENGRFLEPFSWVESR